MPTCCNCCPKEEKCSCACGCDRPKKDCCRKTVNSLLVENKLHVEGCTKLENTTQVDKLCFKDNGVDKCRWCIQETSDDKLTITNECSPLTKITLSPDGTVETNGDVVANGSVKPFRYFFLRKKDQEIPTFVPKTSNLVTWDQSLSTQSGLTFDFTTNSFKIPQTGIYSFTVQLIYQGEANGAGSRVAGILVKDASNVDFLAASMTSAPFRNDVNSSTRASYAATLFLQKDYTVSVQTTQTSGVPLLIESAAVSNAVALSFFEVTQLR